MMINQHVQNTRTELENILVVKIGGGAGLNLDHCLYDLAQVARYRPMVIVHGVSAEMDALCAEHGVEVRTLTSPDGHTSRYTDASTRNLFVEAATRVNHRVVNDLAQFGISATGITDNIVISGERKSAFRAIENGRQRIIRDDYSGSISGVHTETLVHLLSEGYIPVLPPIARSRSDGLLNIDGDRAGAAVASALGAAELVILSNVRGLYRNFPDENSFVSHVTTSQTQTALNWAQGRMKRKIIGAIEALQGGVQRVIIADGRTEAPIQNALNGLGTEFTE